MAADLTHHHRVTLEKIFSHPLSGNVEWRQVLSLLEAVGTTTQEPNGKVRVELGGETKVLQPPDDKDLDRQLILDLRRMLINAGLDRASEAIRCPIASRPKGVAVRHYRASRSGMAARGRGLTSCMGTVPCPSPEPASLCGSVWPVERPREWPAEQSGGSLCSWTAFASAGYQA